MESRLRLSVLFVFISITFLPAFAQAFGQATHLYIADHVFPDSLHKLDLYYGGIGPDIDFFVKHPEKWPTAFEDTHYNFVDMRAFARNPQQWVFASGWFTHNQKDFWGADHYAHIDPAYVINKARKLPDIPPEFAHLAIEVAVDVLLKDNADPRLGEKLLTALQQHSPQGHALLAEVFVTGQKRTNRHALAMADVNFRNILIQYATALSLPSPDNRKALAEWGVMLARKLYRIKIPASMLLGILDDAIDLVKDDYRQTVDTVIRGIKENIR
jgi:hypothetical protein